MGLLGKFFKSSRSADSSQFAHSQLALPDSEGARASIAARDNTRRELLRVVLRDTLSRQGIPAAWLGAEIFSHTSRHGARSLHWRLIVKHWDPRLMVHAGALQQKLIYRVMTFDPLAANWLAGVSWAFAIPDESVFPSMPHPGSWTAPPPDEKSAAPAASAAIPTVVDVIAGPVRIPDPARSQASIDAEVQEDLQRLFALRDQDYQVSADTRQFVRTEPSPLR
jgi:hypothetical protein